jgi:hypothetical protein
MAFNFAKFFRDLIRSLRPPTPTTKPTIHTVKIHVTGDQISKSILGAEVTITSEDSLFIYKAITNIDGVAEFPEVTTKEFMGLLSVKAEGYFEYSGTFLFSPDYEYYPIDMPKIPPVVEPWNNLTLSQLSNFRGNFCGFRISGLPVQRTNQTGKEVAYTPALFTWDSNWQDQIIAAYQQRRLVHIPVVIHNGLVYGDIYNSLNLSVEQRRELLKGLYRKGLIPVVTTHSDGDDNITPDFIALADLIRVAFVKWEMNQPDGNMTMAMARHILQARQVLRHDCLLFVHFSPKHGAGIGDQSMWYNPSDPFDISDVKKDGWIGIITGQDDANGMWWQWAAKVGVCGILIQADPDENVELTISLIDDFTDRFGRGINGWPKEWVMPAGGTSPMIAVVFEIKAHAVHADGMSEMVSNNFNDQLRAHKYTGMQPAGYCNG